MSLCSKKLLFCPVHKGFNPSYIFSKESLAEQMDLESNSEIFYENFLNIEIFTIRIFQSFVSQALALSPVYYKSYQSFFLRSPAVIFRPNCCLNLTRQFQLLSVFDLSVISKIKSPCVHQNSAEANHPGSGSIKIKISLI